VSSTTHRQRQGQLCNSPGGHGVYWEQIRHQVVEVAPLFDGARFFWAVPGYIPAEVASALPDLSRPEVTGRMATLVVQGTTPGAGLTMRSQDLVRDYGLDEVGWSHRIGDLQAIIRTVDERIAAGDWFVTPLWQPQYLNDVHDLRPLDDPRGVFPPPDRASLVAHRDAFDRLPGRTRDVLRRIRFTVADVNAMDGAVNLHGLDPLGAARAWMDRHGDEVRAWLD
jgi:glycine betaine/proline transport system substrate-binding protein